MAQIVTITLLCASLSSGAMGLDEISLIQKYVNFHNQTASSCDCLDWSDAYQVYGAACGDGHEMDIALEYGLSGPEAADTPQLHDEFCVQYFSSLPKDNFCQKTKFDAEPKQWCYVKSECAEGETSQGSGSLKTKLCSEGHDKILGDMPFEDFAAFAHKNKLELGLITQYAYPTFQGAKLPDVQSFWGLAPGSDAVPMTEELRQRLQQVKDSGKTTFFTSRDGEPPYGVAEGEKFYWINFSKMAIDYIRTGNDEEMWEHKEDMNRWACVAGCEKVSAVW